MSNGTRLGRAGRGGRLRALVVLLMLIVALAAVEAAASDGFAVTRYAFNGGGGVSQVGDLRLTGSVGQPIVGSGSNGEVSVDSGFWWGPAVSHAAYLPLVR